MDSLSPSWVSRKDRRIESLEETGLFPAHQSLKSRTFSGGPGDGVSGMCHHLGLQWPRRPEHGVVQGSSHSQREASTLAKLPTVQMHRGRQESKMGQSHMGGASLPPTPRGPGITSAPSPGGCH